MSTSETTAADYLLLRELLAGVLEEYLKGPVPEPAELKSVEGGLTDAHRRWLMLLDLCAAPEALRTGITKRSPGEEPLIALLNFFTRMGRQVDHDRFDWTITYLFRRRIGQGDGAADGTLGAEITRLFPHSPQPPLSDHARAQVEKLASALAQVISFTSFSQLSESGLIEKGREIKESFREERYHPAVLAAVVKYNLVLGKTFRALFDEAATRSRELAAKLAEADYRSNVEPLRKMAKESAVAARAKPDSGPGVKTEVGASRPAAVVRGPMIDPLKELGIDHGREAQKLRFTQRTLVAFFELPAQREQLAARAGNVTMTFSEWEARSFQANYPETDTTFRAQFARVVRDGATLLFRIAEESEQLTRKSASEYLWKPHYDALLWLFAKGREHVEAMHILAEATGKRGLPAKQEQLLSTAGRLTQTIHKGSRELSGAALQGANLIQ